MKYLIDENTITPDLLSVAIEDTMRFKCMGEYKEDYRDERGVSYIFSNIDADKFKIGNKFFERLLKINFQVKKISKLKNNQFGVLFVFITK